MNRTGDQGLQNTTRTGLWAHPGHEQDWWQALSTIDGDEVWAPHEEDYTQTLPGHKLDWSQGWDNVQALSGNKQSWRHEEDAWTHPGHKLDVQALSGNKLSWHEEDTRALPGHKLDWWQGQENEEDARALSGCDRHIQHRTAQVRYCFTSGVEAEMLIITLIISIYESYYVVIYRSLHCRCSRSRRAKSCGGWGWGVGNEDGQGLFPKGKGPGNEGVCTRICVSEWRDVSFAGSKAESCSFV